MIRILLRIIPLATLAGCHAGEPREARGVSVLTGEVGGVTNLALGSRPEQGWIAREFFNERTDWPSSAMGYRFDDVQTYAEILIDEQFSFDGFGGVYRTGQSYRSGTFVR